MLAQLKVAAEASTKLAEAMRALVKMEESRAKRRRGISPTSSLSEASGTIRDTSSDEGDEAPYEWGKAAEVGDAIVLENGDDVFLFAGARVRILLKCGEHAEAKVLDVLSEKKVLVRWEETGATSEEDVRCIDEVRTAPDDGRWRTEVNDTDVCLIEAAVARLPTEERAVWHPWLRVANDLLDHLGNFGQGATEAAQAELALAVRGKCELEPLARKQSGRCDICGAKRTLSYKTKCGFLVGSRCAEKLEAINEYHQELLCLGNLSPKLRAEVLASARDEAFRIAAEEEDED